MDRDGVGMIDVFTFGEAMIRLSVRPGENLESATSFDVHTAGAEANVANTLARLGRTVTWGSRLPEGPLGRRVVADLRAAGVDCSRVALVPDSRIGTYFVELRAEPLPANVIYDRTGSAAAGFTSEDIPWDVVDQARVVYLSGITPALSQSCRDAVMELAARARKGTCLFAVDVNYRSKLWPPGEAATTLARLIQGAGLVVCTSEDAGGVFGITSGPDKAAEELGSLFEAERAVVTSGAAGAWWYEDGVTGHVPSVPVSVVDRIGAGDAFTAGVIDGLLDGHLESGVHRGTALAALALATRGDRAITTRDQMESLIAGAGRRVDR
jgi:2-dehydro-3-deoxygluconokinase